MKEHWHLNNRNWILFNMVIIGPVITQVPGARTATRNQWHFMPCPARWSLGLNPMDFVKLYYTPIFVQSISILPIIEKYIKTYQIVSQVSEIFHEYNITAMLDLSCCLLAWYFLKIRNGIRTRHIFWTYFWDTHSVSHVKTPSRLRWTHCHWHSLTNPLTT